MNIRASHFPHEQTSELDTSTIGHALVVHPPGGLSPAVRSLAGTLPPDPDHDLVVAELPADSPSTAWEQLADALPRGRRGIRLVVEGKPRELGMLSGHWLAERLGRTVVAPDGELLCDLGGTLFVDAGPETGWVRFRPGRGPVWESKRYPQPPWESEVVSHSFRVGESTVSEPLPAGVWLRPDGPLDRLDAGRARLRRTVPCRTDVLTIVLGGRHLPELDLAAVERLWEVLPPEHRPAVRFVHYGSVSLPPGVSLGHALANLLGEEVICYTGIPLGYPNTPEVHLLRDDGSQGWNSFIQQLAYLPGSADRAELPRPRSYRPPFGGMEEVAPGVYRYASDAVIEVVPAGLWIRPPEAPAHAGMVRAVPANPVTCTLHYEDSDPELIKRMWMVVYDVLARLDYGTRLVSEVMPAAVVYAMARPGAAAVPARVSTDEDEPAVRTPVLPSADTHQGTEDAIEAEGAPGPAERDAISIPHGAGRIQQLLSGDRPASRD